ncbi:MAG: thiamine-phosphate kinase [Thermoplasmatales archaeon]
MKLNEIGERGLIEKIWEIMGRNNEDEDVHFYPSGDKYILLAMDSINEKFHFRRDWDPELIGKFLVDINLSDIASKNGSPSEMMASFSFPRNIEEDWVISLVKGIKRETERFNVRYEGGDLKEAESISLTGLIIGEVEIGKEYRRSGAKPGDFVYISSKVGRIEKAIVDYYNSSSNYREILDFTPRFDALRVMRRYRITSCIDNSDGLYKSLELISKLSGVRIEIENDIIDGQFDQETKELFYSIGGDYELIFTSPDQIDSFPQVGRVLEGDGVFDISGKRVVSGGYDHFSQTFQTKGKI